MLGMKGSSPLVSIRPPKTGKGNTGVKQSLNHSFAALDESYCFSDRETILLTV